MPNPVRAAMPSGLEQAARRYLRRFLGKTHHWGRGRPYPGMIIGYRRDGRPIRLAAGGAGWAFVQSASNTAIASTAAATFPNHVAAGNKIIAAVTIADISNATATCGSVKDAALNSWTKMGAQTYANTGATQGGEVSIWALDVPAGDVGISPVLTATASGTGSIAVAILACEVSGLLPGNTTAILDGSPAGLSGTGGQTSTGSPAYSSTASNEFLTTIYGDVGNGTTWANPAGWQGATAGPGSAGAVTGINNSGACDIELAYKNSTNGAETGSFGISGSSSAWACLTVAFQLAAAVVPSSRQQQFPPSSRPGPLSRMLGPGVPFDQPAGIQTSPSGVTSVSDTDSGTGTDDGELVGVSSADSGTGTDAGSVLAQVSDQDSGTGTDGQTLYLFQSDSGTGTDSSGSVTAAISSSDSGTGTDQGVTVGVSSQDSGTGTDSSGSVTAAISSSDSGTGTDGQTLYLFQTDSGTGTDSSGQVTAAISSSDSGTGTDSQFILVSSSDSGTGTDGQSVSIVTQISSSDSGTGTDSNGPPVVLAPADSGTGTDTGSVLGEISSSDSGTGTDGQALYLFQTDSGTGTDAGSVLAEISSSDSGTGTDSSTPPVVLAPADSGTGSDTGSVLGKISSSDSASGSDTQALYLFQSDSGSGTDAGLVLGQISSSDSGTGTDLSVSIGVSSSDSATGTDTGSVPSGNTFVSDSDFGIGREGDIEYPPDGSFIQAPSADSAAGAEAQSVLAQVSSFDSGTGTDSQSVFYLVQAVSDSDSGTGQELWFTLAPKSDSDSGAGTDAQVLIYGASDSDSGTGTDVSGQLIVYSWLPYGLFNMPGGTGGLRVVWRPGTDEERELLRVPDVVPSRWLTEYAEMIRLSDSLVDVSDSDSATGVESSKPTATVVQFVTPVQVVQFASPVMVTGGAAAP